MNILIFDHHLFTERFLNLGKGLEAFSVLHHRFPPLIHQHSNVLSGNPDVLGSFPY